MLESDSQHFQKSSFANLTNPVASHQRIHRSDIRILEDRKKMDSFYPADVLDFFSLLSAPEQAALTRLRQVLNTEVKPHIAEYWEKGEFPQQIVKPLVDAGMMNPTELQAHGELPSGLFGGFRNLELARTDVSVATFYNAVSGLFRTTVLLGGSEEQVALWDPQIMTFDFTGSFSLTEPDHGSDIARGIQTTASKDGDGWILNGAKRWIGGCSQVDNLALFAKGKTPGEVFGFIVPKDAPGITLTKIQGKTSLRIMQNFDITIENVRITDEYRLKNINTFPDVAGLLRNMRSDVSWSATGGQIGAYEAALNYVLAREQFGKPIASFQLIQEKLATMLANITASLSTVVRLTQQQDNGIYVDANSALAKRFTAARFRETAALAREVVGGNGILLQEEVARFHADAEAVYSYEGTDEMNALVVGRSITGINAFK